MRFRALLAAASALSFFGVASADFPEPYSSEPPEAQPPPPDEALAMLRLPAGFTANLFAAEPDVRNPIAMAWDHRGRMWVAENFTYAERSKRFDLNLRDRVLIFEDTNGDGRADQRKVFTDRVQMLTSVEVGRGGVWLMCPPQLLFIPDADGDDIPDSEPQVILDGFTVAKDNYHNFANGLRWGPDGWLYGRCGHSCPANIGLPGTPEDQRVPMKGGIWRYHPERKAVEVIVHGTTNPWGHDWDEHGEGFFINVVHGHLWHLIPGAHCKESGGVSSNPHVFERLDMHADHWHFDTTKNWQDSRDGKASDFGGGHAHVGMMIYQADQWPEEYRGKLFTLNLHGRRANVERLERSGSGFVGRHEDDRFFSDNTWFRGIDIRTGPDGSGYILDWSDTGECHSHGGVHRTSGRIYRISHGEPKAPDFSDLAELTPDGVERLLRHPNVWFERQMRERLRDSPPDAAVLEKLWKIASDRSESPVHRLRALWTAYTLGANHPDPLASLLDDESENIRTWAVRLLTDGGAIDLLNSQPRVSESPISAAIYGKLVKMAANDPSALVKLSIASALQRLPVDQRAGIAAALVADPTLADDPNLPSLVWYGLIPLAETDPGKLAEVAAACRWPDTLRWIVRHATGQLQNRPQDLERLLALGAGDRSATLLRGISEGLRGWSKATPPAGWDTFAAATGKHAAGGETERLLRELGLTFGDGRSLDEIRQIAREGGADLATRRAAMKALIAARPPDLREIAESLLGTRGLAGVAAEGMSFSDDPKIGETLTGRFGSFGPEERAAVVDVLVLRPPWAAHLLENIRTGSIPRAVVSAHHARQIRALDADEVTAALHSVWGELRDSPEEKRREIDALKQQLTPDRLARADMDRGRELYASHCAACHKLYGNGGELGPDLTGSGRSDLGYLLENIVDPSAVVGADFRMTLLTMKDGRTLAGTLGARTERTLTLRQPGGDATVATQEIATEETLPSSIMPEGLLASLTPDQIRDLFAYLMHPRDGRD
jgi:putative membrane-bound dehydrogenase-like protein